MTVLKAGEAERFLDGLTGGNPPSVLMAYGPDRGLVSEAIERFVSASGIDASDALATVVLDGATVAGDPGRLADEMNGPGLFGGRRVVRLREAGNDKRLVGAVRGVIENPPPDTALAIEGGDLKRGSTLLTAFERSRDAVALPCYADDEASLRRAIERRVRDGGMRIEGDALDALVEALGADRLASRAEVDKLLLYAHGRDRIERSDVRAVIDDAGAIAADDAVDGALTGDLARFSRAFARLTASKASTFLVLRDLAQQLQVLERAQDGGGGPGAVAKRLRGPGARVHFRRLPALERAAERLDQARTRELIAATAHATLESRRRAPLEADMVERLCLNVARPTKPF